MKVRSLPNAPKTSALAKTALAFGLVLCACGGSDGQGEIRITAFGEAFIEEGIEESEMEDGWSIAFDRFSVSLGEVVVAGEATSIAEPIDLTQASNGQGQEIAAVAVSEGRHTSASFDVLELDVAGIATRGSEQVRFHWVFDTPMRYAQCEAVTVVGDGETATFQLTFHADHLFYDSLVAEQPALRFQALANADSGGDGLVDPSELGAAGIGAYDPGSSGDVEDLWSYLVAAATTVGHVDGEGHCEASPLAQASGD